MSGLRVHLERIYSHLNRLQQPVVSLLQDGLSRDAVERKTKDLPIKLPSELLELYSWRNGTRVPKGSVLNDLHLLPGYYFLSLEDAISSYNAFKDDNRWNRHWFPVFANGGGDFYVAVCADEARETGEILCFLLGIPKDDLLVEFKSMEGMLQTVAACYDEEIFYARPDGYLDADDNRYVALVRELNPHLGSYDKL